jgi:hypothetical protein
MLLTFKHTAVRLTIQVVSGHVDTVEAWTTKPMRMVNWHNEKNILLGAESAVLFVVLDEIPHPLAAGPGVRC